jgi:hypothetical protein
MVIIFSNSHCHQVCLYKKNKKVNVNLGAKQRRCEGIKIKKVHIFASLRSIIDFNGQELMVF